MPPCPALTPSSAIFSRESVVTWNISPAPSASEHVISGVLMYTKPRSWKNECTANAIWLRILNTEPNVFVRARRCALSRRYSMDILFFWRGYVSEGHSPSTWIVTSVTSTAWPLAGDGMIIPVAFMEAPVVILESSLFIEETSAPWAALLRSKVSWIFAKHEPSFTWMNTRFFESRIVRTHPQTVTVRPSGAEVSKSFISVGFIVLYCSILRSYRQ